MQLLGWMDKTGKAHPDADALSRRPPGDDGSRGDGDGSSGSGGGDGSGGDGDGSPESGGSDGSGGDGDGSSSGDVGGVTVLSEAPSAAGTFCIMPQSTFLSATDIRIAQRKDKDLQPVFHNMQTAGNKISPTHPGFKECFLVDGILCRNYVDRSMTQHTQTLVPSTLQNTVLKQLHDYAGHFGVRRTMGKVHERFYWPGYESDVERYVRECV